MAKLVSKVYGDALFEEAMEKNVLSQWYEEIGALRTIFLENPDLAQFLNHPQIIKEEKKKVVEAIFSGKLSDGLLGFLVTVIEKGRQNDMIPICDYFTDRVKAYKKSAWCRSPALFRCPGTRKSVWRTDFWRPQAL